MYENLLGITATLLLHAILALVFLLNLKPVPVTEVKQYEIVNTVAIDESKLLAQLGSVKAQALQQELKAQWAEQQRLVNMRYAELKKEEQRLEKIRLEEEKNKKLAQLEKQRKALEQKHLQEKQRLAKLRQKQEKLKEQARKAEAKRKAEQKRIAEAKRKAEEQAQIAKQKALERQQEAKRLAELERKQAAHQAEIERLKQIARQRQAAREAEIQRQIAAQRQTAQQQRIARVSNIIKQRVQGHWQRPPNTAIDLTCIISIKLTRDGGVTYAQVITSSGHPALDSSAISAVYKASPLPVPQDLYEHFKTFTFTFRPQ